MLTVPLSEVDAAAWPLVGGKGAQLGMLMRAALPVPDGFCITTEAFRGGMDENLATEIRSAYQALGGGPVAVRSSATAEDLPEASFAGQQDTFLNVSGEEAVLEAVRACWQSLMTERAVAYRRDRGIAGSNVAMGVVVQRMVPADAAGVLFTLNPVTGALDELVIEAACGLGDQVVSARVTPDRYRLRRHAPHEVIETEGDQTADLLPPARLTELAQLGLVAERLLGRAADIEWALAGGQLWLLQARAVTAAGPSLPEVRFGSRWNEEQCQGRLVFWCNYNVRETMPYPHTPFSWSFWNYLVFPEVGKAVGLVDPEAVAEGRHPSIADLVEGRAYFNMNIALGMTDFLPRWLNTGGMRLIDAESAEVLRELFRSGELETIRPPLRLRDFGRMLKAPRGLRMVLRMNPQKAWRELEESRREVEHFSQVDLRILNEEQIVALARYFATQTVPRAFPILLTSCSAFAAIAYLTWALPRWGLAAALAPLMSGIQGIPTMETALELWDLAEGADAEVRGVFARNSVSELPAALRATAAGREFMERLDGFLRKHGHRAVREFDFSCPRWREDPTFLFEMLRNYLSHPPDQATPRQHYERQVARHEEAKAEADRRLRWRPFRRWILRRCVRAIETRLPFREAFKFYVLIGLAHVRDLYLEAGRRLVARGVLEKQEDFFFLSIPEIERICEGRLDGDWVRQQVPLRRTEFARHMRANPPLVVRSDGKPVVGPRANGAGTLRGTPVSWGVVRGPARILLDPGDGALLRKGEILVAPFTDPGWTPLFLTAGALVMEVGGIMSHGAVVAREYGLPAVVGLKDATRLFRDGELLEVNGATGEVRRVS